MFATDYPHWDFDAPDRALPRGLRRTACASAIMAGNARALYRLGCVAHRRRAAPTRSRPGERKLVEIGGRSIGVFNVDGEYYALRNRCPHQGGPLCDGLPVRAAAGGGSGRVRTARRRRRDHPLPVARLGVRRADRAARGLIPSARGCAATGRGRRARSSACPTEAELQAETYPVRRRVTTSSWSWTGDRRRRARRRGQRAGDELRRQRSVGSHSPRQPSSGIGVVVDAQVDEREALALDDQQRRRPQPVAPFAAGALAGLEPRQQPVGQRRRRRCANASRIAGATASGRACSPSTRQSSPVSCGAERPQPRSPE